MKEHLKELILQALLDLRRTGKIDFEGEPEFVIERCRVPEHGDYACNIALVLARRVGMQPMALAEALHANLLPSRHVHSANVAMPGFINFRLSEACRLSVIRRIFEQGEHYGHWRDEGERITVEYVSANPTGPLHVGHGRGAAYGDSVAALLAARGHRVHREYYVNDNGRQMDILAASVWLRYLELCGSPVRFPDNAYRGDYVYDIARALRSELGDRLRRNPIEVSEGLPPDESEGGDREIHIDAVVARCKKLLGQSDYRRLFDAGLNAILEDIRDDLAAFRVEFDQWFSERSLAEDGSLERAVEKLRAGGHMYIEDGAHWFRASALGDEKDRVVIRENGVPTYFASDIAYLWNKFERGFDRAIYIFGADHHGYVARLKAAALGLGLDPSRIEVRLVQFAVLRSGGQRVQMSTRSGQFVTLRELREDVGSDAARFFYVMRGNDQHLDFDLDLARQRNNENPVYYVQYAHARICSLFRQLEDKQLGYNRSLGDAARGRLSSLQEQQLLATLMRFPEIVEAAAEHRAPQLVATYLRELAQDFHSFYNAMLVLVDDEELRNARLNLCAATRQVLANGMKLIGVSAPETM